MVYIKKIGLVLLLASALTGLMGFASQDKSTAIEDFNTIYKAYLDNPRISMDVTYQYFENHTTSVPKETSYGMMKRDGKNFYNKLMNTETLLNNEYFINIDHTNKVILVNSPINTIPNDGLPIKLDGYFDQYSTIKKDESNKEYITYIFGIASGTAEELQIRFLRKTYLINKITVLYRNGLTNKKEDEKIRPRLEVSYRNITTNPVFPENFFSERKFLSIKGNTVLPSQTYKSYKLYDYKR